MKYRREIDGLRALAVLPVILFHAGFTTFSGGFVGVDIFFVISGYLITNIIVDEMEKGSFSLLNFYERRARRILPALFFVMLCTIPFAWFWMLPQDLKMFSESLVAVPLFASNVLFYLTSGYFDTASELKPLLHTWSLAVEEQYYVLFPLLLLLSWKLGKKWIISMLLVVAIISMLIAQWGSMSHPSFTFYLLPTRGFEILIGGLISLYINHKASINLVSQSVSQLVSLAGLALILFAIFIFDSKTPSPSLHTLLPTLGAGLILVFANSSNLVGRLLGTKLFVGIGLISYSAYLWHQPILAFSRIKSDDKLTNLILITLCLSSIALGYLSWKFVENPFRNKNRVSSKALLLTSITFTIAYISIGLIGYRQDGFSNYWMKNKATSEQIISYHLLKNEENISSIYQNQNRIDNLDCVFNVENITQDVSRRIHKCSSKFGSGILVFGDSHATNLFNTIFYSKNNSFQFLIGITKNGCHLPEKLSNCQYDEVLNFVKKYPNIFKTIVYEKAGYLMFKAHSSEHADKISRLSLDEEVKDMSINSKAITGITDYLTDLSRYSNVIWFGPHIEPQFDKNLVLKKGCNFTYKLRKNQLKTFVNLDEYLKSKFKNNSNKNLMYISQNDLMNFDFNKDFMDCDSLYWLDTNHYSKSGEQHFSNRITPLLNLIKASQSQFRTKEANN